MNEATKNKFSNKVAGPAANIVLESDFAEELKLGS